MNGTERLQAQVDGLERWTINTLGEVCALNKALELPEPPEQLFHLRDKLIDGTYGVLVVGEKKRGKTQFCNALIGREVLPTSVDIATCQVFRIQSGERPSFSLRFEDGSSRTISTEDLARYGSQVIVDQSPRAASALAGDVIHTIDVNYPTAFLPPRVTLFDTPGVGSLYAAHAQITRRFVPGADAVIFVLDSQRPIITEELQFLRAILEHTQDIFFVQTKIDLFGESQWRQIQARNEDILQQRFGQELPDVRIWPVSSMDLLRASASGDSDYLEDSGYHDLIAALQEFLFRAAGWDRIARALAAADVLTRSGHSILTDRLNVVAGEAERTRSSARTELKRRKDQFDAEWGQSGQKQQDLIAKAQRVCELGRRDFRQVIQPGGIIESTQRGRIVAAQSPKQLQEIGIDVDVAVVSAATDTWERSCQLAKHQCVDLLRPFLEAADTLLSVQAAPSVNIDVQGLHKLDPVTVRGDWLGTLQNAYLRWANLPSGLLTLFGQLLVPAATAAASVPAAAASVLFSGLSGWKNARIDQIEQARRQLDEHLNVVMQRIRSYFLDVDAAAGRESLVDEYFDDLYDNVVRHVRTLAERKIDEADAEFRRLEEASSLDDSQRQVQMQRLQRSIAEWDGYGNSIRDATARLARFGGAVEPVLGVGV